MTKKFILFIVEGKNDKREIEAILHTKYFADYKEKYEPYFWTKSGDLTADKSVTEKNILQKLNDAVMDFRKNGIPFNNIKVQDIQEVVQIVDMDGAFIPSENIVRGEDSYFRYTDENIITANVDGARGRNKKKASVLRKLIEVSQVGNIPYSIYFASCNMDHLLFGSRMLPPRDKDSFSFRFQMMCDAHPDRLEKTVFAPGIAANGNYADSWTYIQQNCCSLQRHTNLNLFFGDDAKNPK